MSCAIAREKLVRYVAELRKASSAERATTAIKAGYVGSVVTPMRAIVGNASWGGLLHGVVQPATAALDYLQSVGRSAASGFKVKPHEFREVVNAMDADGVGALWRGFKQGTAPLADALEATRKGGGSLGGQVRRFVEEMSTRLDADQVMNVLEHERVKYKSPIVQTMVDGAFGVLEALDRPFWRAAFDHSTYMQAKLYAVREGLTGRALRARSAVLFENPTPEMLARATDDANFATFKDRNLLSKTASQIKRGIKKAADTDPNPSASPYEQMRQRTVQRGAKVGQVLTELNLPFTGVPSSVAYKLGAVSPLGIFSPKMLGSQAERAQALALAGVGTAMWWVGSELYAKGLITGDVPKDKSEREQFYAEGRIPNAVLVDGHWVGLKSLGPAAIPLFMGAQIRRLADEQPDASPVDLALQGGVASGRLLTQQSYLENLRRTIEAMQDERKAAALLVAQIPTPAVVGQMNRAADPYPRDLRNLSDRLVAELPGGTFLAPRRIEATGPAPRKSGVERVASAVSPFPVSRDRSSPVLDEMDRLGVHLGMPGRSLTIRGERRQRTDDEFRAFVEDVGPKTVEVLETLIASDAYQRAPDAARVTALERVIARQREYARGRERAAAARAQGAAPGSTRLGLRVPAAPPLSLADSLSRQLEAERQRLAAKRAPR